MNGHPNAMRYPVGTVCDEAELIVAHLNNLAATEATLTQLAIASVLSKKAASLFTQEVKKLSE